MKDLFQYILENPDFIILMASCAFLVSFFIRWVIRNSDNSDDDDNGGGGGGSSNDNDDPVLDLPPGVCLPKDKEPEMV